MFAVRDRDSALDLVQDAMLRLSSKYGDHPASEFPMLFQRILQNAIRDWYRRQKVRSAWGVLLSSLSTNRDDEEFDPLESMDLTGKTPMPELPLARIERQQVIETIQKEVEKLPARQREAFLLRYWEELDIAETASAMGCSEGSVKTHCFRAIQTLANALKTKRSTP